MPTNLTSLASTNTGRTEYAIDWDGQNRRGSILFSTVEVEDQTDWNLIDYDEDVSATASWDLTALNLGGRGSATDYSGATKIRLELQWVRGAGSVSIVGTGTNGVGATLGTIVVSQDAPRVQRDLTVTIDSTHKIIDATVSGTIVFKVAILGYV